MIQIDPENETAKAVREVAKVADKAIDSADKLGSFIGRYVRGPAEQAVGMLEDHLKFIRWERKVRLVQRASEIAAKAGIKLSANQIPLNVAAHLMLEGSLEENDDLQDRYAALLANAANENSEVEVRRMHVDILSQLGPIEVRVLDALYNSLDVEGSGDGIIGAYLPDRVETGETLGKDGRPDPFPKPSEQLNVALHNLLRTGCIASTSAFASRDGMTNWVVITPLGISLAKACNPHDK